MSKSKSLVPKFKSNYQGITAFDDLFSDAPEQPPHEHEDKIRRFKDLPFWCGGGVERNGDCCFNHIVGLPEKNKRACPIYDYELDLLKLLETDKYFWIKKSRGLGITEFFLRYLCWLGVCKNEIFKRDKFFIVCGPREQTAIDLIKRIKTILRPLQVLEDTQRTIAEFLTVQIQAFPSHHLNTMRGFTDVSFILIDEADFFPPGQQQETRDVSEGYIAKTDPYIVMLSTPNYPGGLFETMENDQTPDFMYKRLKLDYTVGLGTIYTKQEIEEARRSPSFEREYNLKYGYGTGNVFDPQQIDKCIVDSTKGKVEEFESLLKENIGVTTSMGIDPGFGSSKFAVCVLGEFEGKLHTMFSQEYERADITYVSDMCFDLITKYKPAKIYVDASSPELIRTLKININENPDYDLIIQQCRKDKVDPAERMRIRPVSFAPEGRGMLDHMRALVSDNLIVISREFEKLIQQMRIAKILESSGKLDKYSGPTMDSLDACMLAASLWKFQ